jgi:hypothetical protein
MAISEGDYNQIIADMMHLAEIGSEYYMDSLAVVYVIMKKLGDRNADMWVEEMKENGMPPEWESIRDGKYREMISLERKIKSIIGVCLNNSKLSLKTKFIMYKIRKRLEAEIDYAEKSMTESEIAYAYRVVSLYTLTGDKKAPRTMIVGDSTYKKLPLYVQWIEKYMWR